MSARVEVLLNGVWTLVYTGPASVGANIPLASLPTTLASFTPGLVGGVRLSCTVVLQQCYHSISSAMQFSLTGGASLNVSGSNFVATGPSGGPFTGSPTNFTTRNVGAGTLTYSIAAPAWLTLTPPSGSLAAGAQQISTATVNATANSLAVGVHTGTIAWTSDGGTASFTATLTISDNVSPVINNTPTNMVVNTPPGSATATVNWTPPTATDNVAVTSFTLTLTPGGTQPVTTSSFAFPIGVTKLAYDARDAVGNSTQTSFTVTVVDNVSPVIAGCPANQTLQATGPAGATATWASPTATDNSGTVSLASTHAPDAPFALGTTPVIYTATDTSANVATCTFSIVVQDTLPPAIGPVANITVTAPDLVGANVAFTLPPATDAVDASVTVTASPVSGSLFKIGVHTVTVTAVDDYSNELTKTFTVTVLSPAQMSVTPAANFVSTGPQGQKGAPFAPPSQAYVVTNNGQVAMDFTVTDAPPWASAAPASGTLAPGASATVTVSLTAGADTLSPGAHNATFAFNNTTSSIGSTTRTAQLTVLAPAAMSVTPATAFVSSGPQGQQGGAFTPTSAGYTIQNTGALPMTFAITGAPTWVTLSATGGTIQPGASQTITMSLNAAANALPVGTASGTLTITNTTNGIGNTSRSLTLNVIEPARLSVTPADGLVASGFQGGPFSPASKTFTLTNTGGLPLSFSAGDNQTWLEATPASGTIAPGASATVTLSINGAANTLGAGTFNGLLALTNATSNLGSTTRPATLTVVPNGQVILKVVTSEGDGTFKFSSPTSGLAMSLTTSGGVAQSPPVTLNPGTYNVAVAPPDGFGITAVSCSDSDSTGSASSKSANVVLASAETVTCTFQSVNSRKKTVELISRFMGRRNDMLLTNGPDASRQIDRLIEAGGQNGKIGPEAGAGADTGTAKTTGFGPRWFAGDSNALYKAPGFAAVPGNSPSNHRAESPSRSFEERLSGLGGNTQVQTDNDQRYPERADTGSSEGYERFSFATSLSKMVRSNADAKERNAQELLANGQSDLGMGSVAVRPKPSAFDVWLEGHYQWFSDGRNKSDSDGHFGVFYIGADYVLSPSLLVGALVQFDSMHERSHSQAFDINGHGWMVGPYATLRLSQNVFLQARAAWGKSSNEISPFLTYTDSFETTRWLASASLVGRWEFSGLQVQPTATLAFIEDRSEGYTDSLGVAIPGLKVSLGQFKMGPQFSYRFELANGTMLEPHVGLEAIWNFESSDRVADFGGTLSGPEEVRGRIEVGLRSRLPSGVGFDISGSYDGIGSSTFQAMGGKATLRVPFN